MVIVIIIKKENIKRSEKKKEKEEVEEEGKERKTESDGAKTRALTTTRVNRFGCFIFLAVVPFLRHLFLPFI